MVRQRLARLERTLANARAEKCSRCGGRNGRGGVPLITRCGETEYGTYEPPGLCPRCGAKPSHLIDIVTPMTGHLAPQHPDGAAKGELHRPIDLEG